MIVARLLKYNVALNVFIAIKGNNNLLLLPVEIIHLKDLSDQI